MTRYFCLGQKRYRVRLTSSGWHLHREAGARWLPCEVQTSAMVAAAEVALCQPTGALDLRDLVTERLQPDNPPPRYDDSLRARVVRQLRHAIETRDLTLTQVARGANISRSLAEKWAKEEGLTFARGVAAKKVCRDCGAALHAHSHYSGSFRCGRCSHARGRRQWEGRVRAGIEQTRARRRGEAA